MSSERTAQIEKISELCRVLLQEIRSGHLADFSRFGDQFDVLFTQLKHVEESTSEQNVDAQFRRALRDMERVRAQLFEELAQHRTEISSNLLNLAKGRHGIEKYRSTLTDPDRGTKRGEG